MCHRGPRVTRKESAALAPRAGRSRSRLRAVTIRRSRGSRQIDGSVLDRLSSTRAIKRVDNTSSAPHRAGAQRTSRTRAADDRPSAATTAARPILSARADCHELADTAWRCDDRRRPYRRPERPAPREVANTPIGTSACAWSARDVSTAGSRAGSCAFVRVGQWPVAVRRSASTRMRSSDVDTAASHFRAT